MPKGTEFRTILTPLSHKTRGYTQKIDLLKNYLGTS